MTMLTKTFFKVNRSLINTNQMGVRLFLKIYLHFFQSLVRQDQAFFDSYGSGKLCQHITGKN